MNLTVNGEPLKIPTLKQPNNLNYPTNFNNRLILLGTFENETVSVTIKSGKQINDDSICFGAVSLNKMSALTANLNTNDIQANASGNSLELTVKMGIPVSCSLFL